MKTRNIRRHLSELINGRVLFKAKCECPWQMFEVLFMYSLIHVFRVHLKMSKGSKHLSNVA